MMGMGRLTVSPSACVATGFGASEKAPPWCVLYPCQQNWKAMSQ